jgi:hypothetical protein
MVNESTDMQPSLADSTSLNTGVEGASDEIARLRGDFQSRLVAANLRTEAVRAGMVDLDGLKLIDHTSVRLGDDDKIIGARKIMDDLRRNKPWLFPGTSSSSPAVAPSAQPVRQKTALEMSDEEYIAARNAVTKRHY